MMFLFLLCKEGTEETFNYHGCAVIRVQSDQQHLIEEISPNKALRSPGRLFGPLQQRLEFL